MLFDPLIHAWRSGGAAARAGATLELRNLSGEPLGWNRAGQETNLTVTGEGVLTYYRRGDFGERGDKPAGEWRGFCEGAEVDEIWNALEGLEEKDFLGRAADPGESVTQLHAQCAGKTVVITWGPGQMGVARPGVDALAPLRRLTAKAQAEALWTLRLENGQPARKTEGLSIPLGFVNDGSRAVNFLVSPPGQGADLTFKYAVDESDESGPPLQINWMTAEARLPSEASLRIAAAEPGEATGIETLIPVDLAPGRYLGQFAYSQLGLGERVAGQSVFAGMAFTGVFNFSLG